MKTTLLFTAVLSFFAFYSPIASAGDSVFWIEPGEKATNLIAGATYNNGTASDEHILIAQSKCKVLKIELENLEFLPTEQKDFEVSFQPGTLVWVRSPREKEFEIRGVMDRNRLVGPNDTNYTMKITARCFGRSDEQTKSPASVLYNLGAAAVDVTRKFAGVNGGFYLRAQRLVRTRYPTMYSDVPEGEKIEGDLNRGIYYQTIAIYEAIANERREDYANAAAAYAEALRYAVQLESNSSHYKDYRELLEIVSDAKAGKLPAYPSFSPAVKK